MSKMRPLSAENQNTEALVGLGRASVQIVHDLKNQLNGLKLYATFLRKRFETHERPTDERETIAKIIAGLERAAADMTTLVRYGRPLELQTQPDVELSRLLAAAKTEGQAFTPPASPPLRGKFDAEKLAEAFKAISMGARSHAQNGDPQQIILRCVEAGGPAAVIEWRGVKNPEGADLFNSFAGGEGLRMALAANIVRAHGGSVTHDAGALRVQLPIESVSNQ